MTQTKVIGESVKRTERNFVKAYTDDYAKAITENYRQYHIHTLTGNLSGNYPEYAREQLDAIENGTANLMWFKVYSGKRYYKIVQQEFETWEKSKYYGQYRDGSVHAFVDKEEYIERLKEQYIELYDLEIKDHEITNIEEYTLEATE